MSSEVEQARAEGVGGRGRSASAGFLSANPADSAANGILCRCLFLYRQVKLALICNKVTNTTGEVQNDVAVEQSFFFPLENLNTPVTVTLDPPNRLGRTRIDLVDSEGKLKFGTKPTKATCSLVGYDKTVVVNLMVCVKVVQEKSDDKLIVDFYEHDSEVPKGDFQVKPGSQCDLQRWMW